MWNHSISSKKQSSGKEEYLIQHRIWSWKHTYPLKKQLMHNKNIFPLISVFHSLSFSLGLFTFLWRFPLALTLSLISYPLEKKKTEIGRLTAEDIIYLRLSFESYKISGFKLCAEKQCNTSTGKHSPCEWTDLCKQRVPLIWPASSGKAETMQK